MASIIGAYALEFYFPQRQEETTRILQLISDEMDVNKDKNIVVEITGNKNEIPGIHRVTCSVNRATYEKLLDQSRVMDFKMELYTKTTIYSGFITHNYYCEKLQPLSDKDLLVANAKGATNKLKEKFKDALDDLADSF